MAPKPMHMLYTWAYDHVVWAQRLAQVKPGDLCVVTHEDRVPPNRVPVLGRREAVIVHSQPDPAAVRAVLDAQPWFAVSVRRDGADGNPYDGPE